MSALRVLIAPDSFGGTLSARAAAEAIVDGWQRSRPNDQLTVLPMSDGGEGLIDALVRDAGDELVEEEVVGPLGTPVRARFLLRGDGTAVIGVDEACGLVLVSPEQRDPRRTTSFGVGELLLAARARGARRILVGLGGSATIDAGVGALTGLGYRVRIADGSGLKIGGGELHRLERIDPGWAPSFAGIDVQLLADVETPLVEAAERFGPQKGADADTITALTAALGHAADVLERDLAGGRRLRDLPGSGAAGGLGFALMAALDAALVPGVERIAELQGLRAAIRDAELVVTGEGRLDRTSFEGKVVGAVCDQASVTERPVLAVVGQHDGGDAPGLRDVTVAAPKGPGPHPAEEVAAAATALARRVASAGQDAG